MSVGGRFGSRLSLCFLGPRPSLALSTGLTYTALVSLRRCRLHHNDDGNGTRRVSISVAVPRRLSWTLGSLVVRTRLDRHRGSDTSLDRLRLDCRNDRGSHSESAGPPGGRRQLACVDFTNLRAWYGRHSIVARQGLTEVVIFHMNFDVCRDSLGTRAIFVKCSWSSDPISNHGQRSRRAVWAVVQAG